MTAKRIFVEKRPSFRAEASSLREDFSQRLSVELPPLRLLNIYDLDGFSDELLQECLFRVFAEGATDSIVEDVDLQGRSYIAQEYLPGQFDQRAAAAEDCVRLLAPSSSVRIKSGRLLLFEGNVDSDTLSKVKSYYINPVESREKDLSRIDFDTQPESSPVRILEGFREMKEEKIPSFIQEEGLAMSEDDILEVIGYFTKEGRDPSETELRILDTYWSDHCRHTTFSTCLDSVKVEDSFAAPSIRATLGELEGMRKDLGRDGRPLCLMEVATIGARYISSKGYLPDQEKSEENNACSIFVDVQKEGGSVERWLLQFKNETHNHPTEIEPFGGASTCLGGAIRDPLSGRAYVYQAMRVSGAGDIYRSVEETLPGKLPQIMISRKAAHGYSSYGNQIGLATTHVREIYHEGYEAKRLEVGAVVGAVRADCVRRESPAPGDVVIMIGGRTGRDGIGGATGSSKEHNRSSLTKCASEVQKGNAPEERKLQRLFSRKDASLLIKKSNDFGAGGVSVAVGELAPGLDIFLDRVPVKYSGLSATELAISESQERMAVVIERKDMEKFLSICREENLEATHIADVTSSGRMVMHWRGQVAADISREFIDSAGASRHATAVISAPKDMDPFERSYHGTTFRNRLKGCLSDPNVLSQKGLVEMFDSSIGASTVLMPFGGKFQRTESQVSLQRMPCGDGTLTASLLSFGFNPYLSAWSPYHGAAYAVVDAVAKAAASGAPVEGMRFSYQEYFKKMKTPSDWGLPLGALLGALRMQTEMHLPSIGGKDSMSGTFGSLSVPPTLIAFGVATMDSRDAVSPEFKGPGHDIYLLSLPTLPDRMPDTSSLMENCRFLHRMVKEGRILSAYAVGFGGVAEAVSKMSFGNGTGAEVTLPEDELFRWKYGSIVIESEGALTHRNLEKIGRTLSSATVSMAGETFGIEELYRFNSEKFLSVYPDCKVYPSPSPLSKESPDASATQPIRYKGPKVDSVSVYIPVFCGTNCELDTEAAFRRAGATVRSEVFRDLDGKAIEESLYNMEKGIGSCQILSLCGGFSLGDEPDGSGKFISSVLSTPSIRDAIYSLLERGGLIIGICNGFQALVKSGLLPYGEIRPQKEDSPTLFRNEIGRHVSRMARTRVSSTHSPFLSSFALGDEHTIAVSHGEGRLVCPDDTAKELLSKGQVAFQYMDNPNGSTLSIEGLLDPSGQILGKMGHTERYVEGLMKNIPGCKRQPLFENAVKYFLEDSSQR